MDDFFDDFDGDFDEGEFMDGDSFEDPPDDEFESECPLDQEDPIEHDSLDDDIDHDKFDIEDAFILGGAMGLAFEAGMNEAEQKRLSKEQGKKEKQTKKEEGS